MYVWEVTRKKKIDKMYLHLREEYKSVFRCLINDLKMLGPYQPNWPKYGPLVNKKNYHHCHIKRGRPTIVVVWKILDKKNKIMEVIYVGTHEKAPY